MKTVILMGLALASWTVQAGNIQVIDSYKTSIACQPLKTAFLKDNGWGDDSDVECDHERALLLQAARFDLAPEGKITKGDIESIAKAFLKTNAAALGITAAQIADFYFDIQMKNADTLAKVHLSTQKDHFYPGFEGIMGGGSSPRIELFVVEDGVAQVRNDTKLLLPTGVTINAKPAINLTAAHLKQVNGLELKLVTAAGVEKRLEKASTTQFKGKPELELFTQNLYGRHWVGLAWTQRLFVGIGDVGSAFFARFSTEDGSLISLNNTGPR